MLLNMVMFKVTICDFGKMNINMTDKREKTENGELVTNRDQLVVVDNIELSERQTIILKLITKDCTITSEKISEKIK